jgi:hypothetical protein
MMAIMHAAVQRSKMRRMLITHAEADEDATNETEEEIDNGLRVSAAVWRFELRASNESAAVTACCCDQRIKNGLSMLRARSAKAECRGRRGRMTGTAGGSGQHVT